MPQLPGLPPRLPLLRRVRRERRGLRLRVTKPDGTCTVRIRPGVATARTRRRVKNDGPFFEWFDNLNRPGSILLRSPVTGWFGWLPLDEIEFDNSRYDYTTGE